jgi:hypothetical protein
MDCHLCDISDYNLLCEEICIRYKLTTEQKKAVSKDIREVIILMIRNSIEYDKGNMEKILNILSRYRR